MSNEICVAQDDQLVCVQQEDAEAYDDPSIWNLGT